MPPSRETVRRGRVTLDWTVGAMDGAIEHHGWAFACPGKGDPPPPAQGQGGATATQLIDAIANPGKQKSPHKAGFFGSCCGDWRSLGDSNPCFSLERATS